MEERRKYKGEGASVSCLGTSCSFFSFSCLAPHVTLHHNQFQNLHIIEFLWPNACLTIWSIASQLSSKKKWLGSDKMLQYISWILFSTPVKNRRWLQGQRLFLQYYLDFIGIQFCPNSFSATVSESVRAKWNLVSQNSCYCLSRVWWRGVIVNSFPPTGVTLPKEACHTSELDGKCILTWCSSIDFDSMSFI